MSMEATFNRITKKYPDGMTIKQIAEELDVDVKEARKLVTLMYEQGRLEYLGRFRSSYGLPGSHAQHYRIKKEAPG